MAISITRARAKESSIFEKVKRGPLSSSESTPKTRSPTRILIEITKAASRSSLKNHNAKTSETQISSYYVKPKTSSLSGSQPHSLRQLKNGYVSQKPSLNRMSSHEMPASASISSKPKTIRELSSSRPPQKIIVSFVPPYRIQPLLRTSSDPTPSPYPPPKPTIPPKPISKIPSRTPGAAKPKPISKITSSTPSAAKPKPISKIPSITPRAAKPKPISKIPSSTPSAAKPKPALSKNDTNPKKTVPATKKKVVSAPVSSTYTPESSDAGEETPRLETVAPVNEQGSGALKVEDHGHQNVETVVPPVTEQGSGALKVEDDGHQDVDKVPKIPPHVDTTEQHEQHDKVEPDQPQIQVDGGREIHCAPQGELVSITEVEEAKGEPQEEKTKCESTSQGESNNWRHEEEQPATDGDVEVKEKEKEGAVIRYENSENNKEEKTLQTIDGEEARIREDKTDGGELVPKTVVEEVKTESTPAKAKAGRKSQESVNAIKETTTKLMETKKNRVRALAGAFQSVIDHQAHPN